jgi:hypothetical protein
VEQSGRSPPEQEEQVEDAPRQPTRAEREDRLNIEIGRWAAFGRRVESRSEFQAILVRGHRHNHILHLLLSIITAGLWALFVWLPLSLFGGEKRELLKIDEWGEPSIEKLG